jgi:exopolysaccharide biosynthesis polyprenyl glycosylphosphotransferase
VTSSLTEFTRRAGLHVPRQRGGDSPQVSKSKAPGRTTPTSAVWVVPAVAVLADIVSAAVGLVLAEIVVPGGADIPDPYSSLALTFGVTVLWVLAITACRGHDSMALRAGVEGYRRLLKATLATAALVGFGCYVLQVELSRDFFVVSIGAGLALMVMSRVVLRQAATRLRRHGLLVQRVLIVGEEQHVDEFSAVLERHKALGFTLVGALTPRGEGRQTAGGVRILGEAAEAGHLASVARADLLLFAGGGVRSSAELRRVTWDLQDHPVRVAVAPSITDIAPERIRMRPVGSVPMLDLEKPRAAGASKKAKRLFDIVGSLMVLIAVSPLFLFVAWRIKRHDGGPVFFRHERIGRDEVPFGCWKFRTMGVNADELLAELLEERGVDGAIFAKLKDDPRITPPGRWLRRSSLDELPQLINVLLGHMSLVGPRPQVAAEVAEYDEVMARRLHVKPGMTGLWQVSGRSDLSLEDSIRLDSYYVENWSMLRDLSILFRTPVAVLASRGAY